MACRVAGVLRQDDTLGPNRLERKAMTTLTIALIIAALAGFAFPERSLFVWIERRCAAKHSED